MRRLAPPTVDVRAHRAARLRLLIHQFGNVAEDGPWRGQLARLEAGGTADVYGWQLPPLARPNGPAGRYRIERDGLVTPIGRGQT